MKNLTKLIICLSITFTSCNSQETKYWKPKTFRKVNNDKMTRSTLFSMEVLLQSNMQFRTKNDSIFMDYPFSKSIKKDDFKSFTDFKLINKMFKVYKIEDLGNKLHIKFNYKSSSDDNRFILVLEKTDKNSFIKTLDNLKSTQQQLIDKIVPLNLENFKLPNKTPIYLTKPYFKLNIFKHIAYTYSVDSKKFELNDVKYKYTEAKGFDLINKKLVEIDNIKFDNIFYLKKLDSDKTELVYIKGNLKRNQLKNLYNLIVKKHKDFKLEQFQLPKSFAKTEEHKAFNKVFSHIALTWSDNTKCIRLLIETPLELMDKKENNYKYLSDKKENYSEKEIKESFLAYVNNSNDAEIKLFISSNEFHHLMNNDYGKNMFRYKVQEPLWHYLKTNQKIDKKYNQVSTYVIKEVKVTKKYLSNDFDLNIVFPFIYIDYQPKNYEKSKLLYNKEQRLSFAVYKMVRDLEYENNVKDFLLEYYGIMWSDAIMGFDLIGCKETAKTLKEIEKLYGKTPSKNKKEREKEINNLKNIDKIIELSSKIDIENCKVKLKEFIKNNPEKFTYENRIPEEQYLRENIEDFEED